MTMYAWTPTKALDLLVSRVAVMRGRSLFGDHGERVGYDEYDAFESVGRQRSREKRESFALVPYCSAE